MNLSSIEQNNDCYNLAVVILNKNKSSEGHRKFSKRSQQKGGNLLLMLIIFVAGQVKTVFDLSLFLAECRFLQVQDTVKIQIFLSAIV